VTETPAPTAAERARTIATRGGKATLLPSTEDLADAGKITPLMHHVHPDGTASVLMRQTHPLVAAAWSAPRGEVAAMLELADTAPVPLREPIRGLLWLTGWVRALSDDEARRMAVLVSEDRPDPRLLDIGHGATILQLMPASLVLADSEGTQSLQPEEFTAASPDPFCNYEAEWLRHLELAHTDVVSLLGRHLPDELRGGHIRPLGLDRFGLRLRVEAIDADHDVRLAFSQPVSTTAELSAELRQLVGCPFLAQTGQQHT
jgi:hypothetical protein